MAYCEDLEENYENMRTIFELLQLDQLNYVIAADLKLLNVLCGLSGHGGKYACIYCEGERGLEAGRLRSLARIIEYYDGFTSAGSDKRRMKEFANVVNVPLLKLENDDLMEAMIPPPELHLMMGAVNHKLNLLSRLITKMELDEELLWTWCDSKGITRRGYNGKNKLDGNNSSRFLSWIDELEKCEWFPIEAGPIVDCLMQFKEIKDKCFGWNLEDGWQDAILSYKHMFSELQVYSDTVLGLDLSCTWKIHVIVCHLKPFLTTKQCGLGCYAEQTGESIHAKIKPVLNRHKRKPGHKEHGTRQQRAVVEFSSNNI